MTQVVNVKYTEYDVYIGRPSKWGNPFRLKIDGTRNSVCDKHWLWLHGVIQAPQGEKPPSLDDIKRELMGKRLGCFCAPLRCHGDNYVKICEEIE